MYSSAKSRWALTKWGFAWTTRASCMDGQVVAAVLGVPQRLVERLDVLALDLQLSGLALNLVQVVVRQVFLRLQIQADHPLDQASETSPLS